MKAASFLLIFLFFFIIACKENPTETITPPDNQPDTTSQNFTFETIEFGDGNESSYFNDVWVFDENNIWAVGYLDIKDSVFLNQGHYNPNIIQWNGKRWKLLPFTGTSSGIYGIWAIDSTNVFLANGIVVHYKNGNFVYEDFSNLPWTNGQAVHHLWGSSESNIYGVGPGGTIVHYNGSNWSKIDFETGWRINDITGNTLTGKAYAAANNSNFTFIIIEISENSAEIIYNSQEAAQKLSAFAIRSINDNKILLSDAQIWTIDIKTKIIEIINPLYEGFLLPMVSVATKNDIYFWGNQYDEGQVMIHYNGVRFKKFNLKAGLGVFYGGLSSTPNIAVAANYDNNKASITLIKRTK